MNAYLQHRTLFGPQIYNRVSPNLGLAVVVPACDEPELIRSLMSLAKCDFALVDTEVIVVIYNELGASAKLQARNRAIYLQAMEWAKQNFQPRRKFHILYYDDLPRKHCGPGLARKIGMDEACYRFEKIRQRKGIITCFDADSRAETNYLTAIEQHFKRHRKADACTIYHEHPLRGIDHDERTYAGIQRYELHQRYVVRALRTAGVPHAFQTVGSSLAVRVAAYQREGGMSKKKCGAGFHFLHKFSRHDGGLTICTTTRVQAAPRPAQRPCYGSTSTLAEYLHLQAEGYPVCPPEAFEGLAQMHRELPRLYRECDERLPDGWCTYLRAYLTEQGFGERLPDLREEASGAAAFSQRFYGWFHAHRCEEFLRHYREQHPPHSLTAAIDWLLEQEPGTEPQHRELDERGRLLLLRRLDRPGT